MNQEDESSYLVFGAPYIGEEEIAEVEACLRSGWLGTGPRVARFERDFAAYKGVDSQQVAAVNSCTAALHVSMIAAGLEPGSEVITTPLTFCATINAIIHADLVPILVDIEPETMNIDPAAIEAAITPRTRAILPVHFAGRPCDMDAIMAIAGKHDLVVIEDCAHAIETEYRGRKAGTFGDFGCFSFYATKNLATGEGGMIVGRDSAAMARARTLALHGMSKDAWHRFSDTGYRHYEVVEAGFKYNMMDIQAALGIHQLVRLEENWVRRHRLWRRYIEAFSGLPVGLPTPTPKEMRHGHHLFTLMIDQKNSGISRDRFIESMHTLGIGTGVHYLPIPEHLHYRERFGWDPDQWPHAKAVGHRTVSIPFSAVLDEEQTDRIIMAVGKVVSSGRISE